jgi:hypothetical protein
LCENIKVPVVLIHALLEEMPRNLKSKYIKHSAHDHNVSKNSEVSGGRITKADRYGTITILDAFLRVDRKGMSHSLYTVHHLHTIQGCQEDGCSC